MRFIIPKVEILKQKEGLDGIYELAAKCGHICYKSEKEITPESAKKFIDALYKKGHGSVLEHGTVYLKCKWNTVDDWQEKILPIKYSKNHFSKVNYVQEDENNITGYITTNLRVLYENHWLEDLKYLCEPTEYHEKRITVKFLMDRVGSQSCMRHRGSNGISFSQESTRYCDYSRKEKFGKDGINYSIPHWTNKETIENVDNIKKNIQYKVIHEQYLHEKDFETTKPFCDKIYYWLAACDFAEFCYMKLIDCGMNAEDARYVLPLGINTEFAMTAFVSDWKHFFSLRVDGSTGKSHPDIQKISTELKQLFVENNII